MLDNFAVFILSHNRPDRVYTVEALRKHGYTGEFYIVCDNEDKSISEYKKNFKNVIVFNKLDMSKKFDEANTDDERRSIVYARNACFEIAKDIGVKYFLQLDDDYTSFNYTEDEDKNYTRQNTNITCLDYIFSLFVEFLRNTKVNSIAFSQGGDYIGGENSKVFKDVITRKCMNSFFCSLENAFTFQGKVNEDVNTYTHGASKGLLFFTTSLVRLEQKQTQSNSGGMTDLYNESGTYIKSFYSVMFQPSSVSVRTMGVSERRLHHSIKWVNTAPMILDEKHKKQILINGDAL